MAKLLTISALTTVLSLLVVGNFVESGRVLEIIMADLVSVAMLFMVQCALVTEANSSIKYNQKFGPYFQHDSAQPSPNATDVLVAATGSNQSITVPTFGQITVFDDPITVTSDINSTTVARAQGIQIVISLDGNNALFLFTLVLPNGTLTFSGPVIGAAPADSRRSLIGGTGDYQSVTSGYFDAILYNITGPTTTVFNVTAEYYKPC